MKTIEEAALHYGAAMGSDPNKPINASYDGFKAGVEFAQRWIPVEEELPETSFCIVKLSDGTILAASFNFDFWRIFFSGGLKKTTDRPVTHWRPIEYK